MQSDNLESRLSTCIEVADLADTSHESLLQSDILQHLVALLDEDHASLRLNAIGALQNLSMFVTESSSQNFVNSGVLPRLSTFFEKVR